MLILGSHVSLKGNDMFLGSVKEALSYKANTMMVYTGAPQNTIRKPIDTMLIKEAHALMKESNIDINHVVVHAPYIINLANPDPVKRAFAVEFLTKEVIRTSQMGINQMVLHPGSAVGLDRVEAVNWIAEGLNEIIENTKELKVKIALETMAGKGNEVGRTFEEIRDIISKVIDKSRVSVCFDTCHVHDSGYDIINDFENTLKKFDEIIGINYISVVHVNDSKNEQGARKDRHENIGFGYIGYDALMHIIYHEAFKNIPKILETPYVEDNPPYKLEIQMIKDKNFDPKLKDNLIK
ncbi:deoxyribonuclease IV [Acholeplasma granularum]|uniref:deoxyribonuclease IV n=1 Tax=Acholeplasma granularum TaxID=264635 RepID=UPI00047008D1|nr:deoxyribonuclease IV [Acholeplasma granularum]